MPRPATPIRPLLLAACVLFLNTTPPADAAESDHPLVSTTRPWTRWWWPGSAVDRTGVTQQLEALAAAGIGGVEITPIYGAQGAEATYREFLTPAWREALTFTMEEAARLGLGVDMATGTGWPFGGPWVDPEDGSQRPALDEAGNLVGAPTAMKVKRAAPGGVGLVVDPFSTAALTRYLAPIGTELEATPAAAQLRAQFHDSFEYYGAGWTAEVAEAFASLHGYALQPHAAALLGQTELDDDSLSRLRADYRSTLGHLHLQFLKTWTQWSHDHGWLTRNQSHGAPANLLDLYGAVDIPETETFGSTPFAIPGMRRVESEIRGNDDLPEPLMMKMASSAAHVMGRPLISSETCTWLREHWKVSLAMAKPEIDRLFANGINHILYHGTVYSPPDVAWPGWLFYASTQFNANNPWWTDFAELNAYVTRVQTVLQAGEPDNEVLLYWPYADVIHNSGDLVQLLTVHHVDWLTESPFGQTARALSQAGYACDYLSDAQLLNTQAQTDGNLTTAGNTYRHLIVPPVEHMPLPTLRQLVALARAGASIQVLGAPADVPGLGRLDERRAEFTTLVAELRSLANIDEKKLDLDPLSMRATTEPMVASGLEYIRRRTESGWSYFITNLTGSDFDGPLPLGVTAATAVISDPLSGYQGSVVIDSSNGAIRRLQLASGQSVLIAALRETPGGLPAWKSFTPNGDANPIQGEWTLTFLSGGPVLPAARKLDAPINWSTLDDADAQRFAGTARYRVSFELPAAPDGTVDWLLDLGDVRESARITINGQVAGTSWSLPHRLRIGDALQPGENVLEIDVTNLGANRIRDLDKRGVEWRIMHEINFVNIRYQRFDASTWELTPSGLLGPVTLTPLKNP